MIRRIVETDLIVTDELGSRLSASCDEITFVCGYCGKSHECWDEPCDLFTDWYIDANEQTIICGKCFDGIAAVERKGDLFPD